MALRSVAWTFAEKPLRRYNLPVEGQHTTPIERPLSIPNLLLDALDLIWNLRGIGWSWSYKPFPSMSTRSTSIPVIIAKLLIKLVTLDVSHYLMQYFRPSIDSPAGDTIFDPTLSMVPRFACAAFYALCGGMVVFATVDVFYHISTLVGRILYDNQPVNGHRSLTAHGRLPRLPISGASAGTNFFGMCSSRLARDPVRN